MKIKKMNIFEISICVCFLLMPLSGLLKMYKRFFTYIDETLLIVFIIAAFFKIRKWKLDKTQYKHIKQVFILVLFFYLWAYLSSFFSNYQESVLAIILDSFSWMKFIMMVPIGILIVNERNVERLTSNLIMISKVIIFFNFILVILNQIFNWNLSGKGIRYGIVSYAIPNMHVAFTVGFFAIIISLLLMNYKKNWLWIIMSVIICLATARFKAFGWIVFMVISFIGLKKKTKFLPLIMATIAMLIVARDALESYFFNLSSSRGIELNTALRIAFTRFPFGGGFASFGTTESFNHYSRAYSIFGLNTRYGYMESAGAFIGDGGWSTQIGQFGYIGTIIFIIILYKLFILLYDVLKGRNNLLPFISIISYILIASISERIFNGDLAPFFSLAFILIFKNYELGNIYEIRTKKKCVS